MSINPYVLTVLLAAAFSGAAFAAETGSPAGSGIALTGHFQFNSSGRCSGWGTFDGEIVPPGRFDNEVTR